MSQITNYAFFIEASQQSEIEMCFQQTPKCFTLFS